jgi:hypothetical protein
MPIGIVTAAQMPSILAREYWSLSSFAFQAVALKVVVLFIDYDPFPFILYSYAS